MVTKQRIKSPMEYLREVKDIEVFLKEYIQKVKEFPHTTEKPNKMGERLRIRMIMRNSHFNKQDKEWLALDWLMGTYYYLLIGEETFPAEALQNAEMVLKTK